MKKFIYFIAIAVIAFCSCTKMETNSTPEVEYIEVPIKTFLNNAELIDESPLTTRANSSNDLYGITIWDETGRTYAIGIYDDISLLTTIKFAKGHLYSISANYMPNGKIICPHYGSREPYEYLFMLQGARDEPRQTPLNEMIYNDYWDIITYGWHNTEIGPEYYRWEVWDYLPEEGKPLEIKYVRTNAGLTLIFEKEEGYNYDSVKITSDYIIKSDVINTTVKLTNGEGTYIIPSITIWGYLNSEDEIPFSFGTEETYNLFWEGRITIKRNTMRTYRIKLKPNGVNTSIDITFSDETVSNENMGLLN